MWLCSTICLQTDQWPIVTLTHTHTLEIQSDYSFSWIHTHKAMEYLLSSALWQLGESLVILGIVLAYSSCISISQVGSVTLMSYTLCNELISSEGGWTLEWTGWASNKASIPMLLRKTPGYSLIIKQLSR